MSGAPDRVIFASYGNDSIALILWTANGYLPERRAQMIRDIVFDVPKGVA